MGLCKNASMKGALKVLDIFISYAHVDNQPFSNGENGWISHFTNHLNNELSRKLGRKDSYSFWQDFRLQGSDAITPEIEKQVKEAKILLILFSPGWLASSWCQRELKLFCEGHPDITKRIFVVELDQVAKENKPDVLRDLLNYPFWRQTEKEKIRLVGYPVPQTSDKDYSDRLIDFSHELANTLKSLQTGISAQPPKATVYVAPVNDSLYSPRSNLISELRQFGIEALPHSNSMDNDMNATLAQCSHFVQLLDANSAFGISANQYQIAEATGKPILQWRDPKLDYSGEHISEAQKKLLEGKTVIAAPLTDFIRMVRETVLPKPAPEPPDDEKPERNGKKLVFVHASQDDFEPAHSVALTLKTKGYGIALPRYQGEPERIRKSIERGYQSCDVMLVLHQKAPADVVEDYLSEARVHALQRGTELPILICQGDGAEELYFVSSGVLTLSCNHNFDEHCLEQFLAKAGV